ncbi:YdcF family protein [Plantibacter sp. VKM Ac-2880]|uniref:YdcF family protein n=1 Tax=Plantibacter sp. VKM Ac-2880 TaxID=2783827 RepID=UPI001890B20D|nr:YdcF family protein [Plantibacter sp. VKM Ac-2880]MBF4570568.1 YdcF family protein [Plantibacter sp. VKM Ac-2880]
MILLLPAVVFAVLYLASRRRDARRLRNGVFLVAAIACALGALLTEAARTIPFTVLLATFGAVVLVGVLAVLLVGNGITMIRLEGRSLGNLLSLFAGVAILVLPVLAVLLVLGLDLSPLPSWAAILLVAVGVLLGFACLYAAATFAAFGVYSLVYSRFRHTVVPDVVVILGSGLIDGQVPPLLRSRLDLALRIHRSARPGTRRPLLIPSGGQGDDEPRPEGVAMAEYLIANGAEPTDVLPETESTSTRENLLRSRELQESSGRTGDTLVVTNNYHVLRAALLARSTGSDAQVIGSPTAAYYVPSAFLREYIAIMVEHRMLNALAIAGVAGLVALAVVWSLLPI